MKAKENINNQKKATCPHCGKISYTNWALGENYWLCISCGKTWVIKPDSEAEQSKNNDPQSTSS